jgi:site-specific DNA recombinase
MTGCVIGIDGGQLGKGGYVVVRKYADEGWSGDMLARPQLDQLRQDAGLNMWDAVLMYDPDRLARRYSYQELVLDELREANKEVHFRTIKAP